MNKLMSFITTFCVLFTAIVMVRNCLNIGTDSTDKNGWHRSGLKVHTDYATGIQYVEVDGALTPRVNADGSLYKEATK